MDLEWKQVQEAVKRVSPAFSGIAAKYDKLKPCMVFSSPKGEASIHADPLGIIAKFPTMLVDGRAKDDCIRLQEKQERLEHLYENDTKIAALKQELLQKVPELRYHSDTRIELRFQKLRYELIWALQQDPLVDRELTLQSRASIRIVMGTLAAPTGEPNNVAQTP